jgi:hypothetical protein
MKLYYHHVGLEGGLSHFTQTIFTKINLADIKRYIPKQEPAFQEYIFKPLEKECPDGKINCWGVPEGAYYKIQDLWKDDYVVLIEHLQNPFLLLTEVIAYQHQKFPELSNFLWEDRKYPYIFFLRWRFLNLNWGGFCRMLGYDPDLNPKGLFLEVGKEALARHGGIGNFTNKLLPYCSDFK